MSYEFAVDMKVVCVDDSARNVSSGLVRGSIYTISELVTCFDGPGLRLHEVPVPGNWFAFSIGRFRPLESKSIELFRAIAADPSKFNFTPSKRERERVRT